MLVLLVEDELPIRRIVRVGLKREGIDLIEAGTVKDAMEALRDHVFDVVILDLGLPDGSGLDVLAHLKAETSAPHVIILSGAVTEFDRVLALERGADDYVAKPFYARELTARLRAVQRRHHPDERTIVRFGRLEIDLSTKTLTVDGSAVHLTAREFALLAFLAVRPGLVFSRNDLLRAVWLSTAASQKPSTVTEHVRRLRTKIEVEPHCPQLLRTVRGAGYRFDLPQTDDPRPVAELALAEAPGIVIYGADGHIVSADAPAAALLGVADEEDLLDKHMLEFTAPQSLHAAEARMRLSLSGRTSRSQVLVVAHADGTAAPLEVTSAAVEWHGQDAVRVELRHAADESVRLRRLVTGVLSDVTDAVIITDMHFHIRSWNSAAGRLYGWTEAEVLGRHILDIVEWVDDDDVLASADSELAATDRWHGEVRQITRDGLPILVRASTTVVRDEVGEPVGLVSVNRHMGLVPVAIAAEPSADDLIGLRRGLERREFEVYYQPVVDLESRRVISVEALVRWHHPVRGLLGPDSFIHIAERSGLILELGSYVLAEACRQAAAWRRQGANISLAVNLSARELADPSLVDRITATITESGLDPTVLWLEVTESALVEDVEQASTLLHGLAALGVGLSIDDFGTGWASLTYLRRFPVHVLKIDRSFVAGIDHDANSTAIARSILSLGAELGLVVVAEGIETVAEEQALRQLGCCIGQGFLYGHPTPAQDVDLRQMHRLSRLVGVGGDRLESPEVAVEDLRSLGQ